MLLFKLEMFLCLVDFGNVSKVEWKWKWKRGEF